MIALSLVIMFLYCVGSSLMIEYHREISDKEPPLKEKIIVSVAWPLIVFLVNIYFYSIEIRNWIRRRNNI
jgi:hypothetical protein